MKNRTKVVIIVVVAVALAAIGAGVAIGMTSNDVLSDDLTLELGKTLEIRLEENPSTGYSWVMVISNENVVEVVKDEYIAGKNIPGASGEHVWIFKGLEEGETQISFSYLRPWEEDSEIDEKVYVIKVK